MFQFSWANVKFDVTFARKCLLSGLGISSVPAINIFLHGSSVSTAKKNSV